MPVALSHVGMVNVGSTFFLFGGKNTKAILEYKPATETLEIFGKEMRYAIYIVLFNVYHERWERLRFCLHKQLYNELPQKCVFGLLHIVFCKIIFNQANPDNLTSTVYM
jgi:hypothetical protein